MSIIRKFSVWMFLLAVVVFPFFALTSVSVAEDQGKTFVVGVPDDPQHLVCGFTSDLVTVQISSQLHSTLVRVRRDGTVEPDLAKSWEISKDGLAYTFHLRDDVKWHDGVEFTSADVAYGLMNINYKYNGLAEGAFKVVDHIDTPDKYTVVFHLKHPYAPFFPYAVGFAVSGQIMPKHIYEGTDPTKNEANWKPIGTGPFVFKEWARGSHIILERNKNYYKKGKPYFDRVIFKIIPDTASRMIAMERGELDYLPYFALPSSEVKALRQKKGVEVFVDLKRGSYPISPLIFNLRHPILKNRDVRVAIAHAIDCNAIVENALDGLGKVGTSPVQSGQIYYNPNVPKYAFDPALANRILDKAGFPRKDNGMRFSIGLLINRGLGAEYRDAGELMRQNLKDVGIDLKLDIQDGPAYWEKGWVKWDYDTMILSLQSGPHPAIGISRLFMCKNIQRLPARNAMGYCNPALDALFDKGEQETDVEKAKVYYNEIQDILVRDLPVLVLWERVSPIAYRTGIEGLPPGMLHHENYDSVIRR